MHRRTPGRWARSGMVVFTLLALASTEAFAAWELNLPVGVTPISRIVYDLHMLILWICVAIGVVVFGVMFISILSHRKAAGAKAAQFHHSTFAEIAWTVIPIVILVAMAVPATTTLIEMEDTTDADLTVKVTAYQWKWKYEYIEDGVTIYSNLAPSSREAIYRDPTKVENYLLEVDNPIVFPVDKKVRLLLTADDVIHAGGSRSWDRRRMRSPVSSTRSGRVSRSPGSIAASAPSCAARTTASCRSWSGQRPKRSTGPGSPSAGRRRRSRRRSPCARGASRS